MIKSTKKIKAGEGVESRKLRDFWLARVDEFERFNSKWWKRGDSILKRFRDERSKMEEESVRRINYIWTNYKIMKPAIYSKCPLPLAERRFTDKDPKGRISAMILERGLRNEIEINDFHEAVNRAVSDYLLPGRGIVWVRYEPEFGKGISLPVMPESTIEDELNEITGDEEDTDEENQLEGSGEQLLAEKAMVDYLDWKDFGYLPSTARTWREVLCIYKKVYMSKEEAIERFGDDIGEKIQPDTEPQTTNKIRNQAGMSVDNLEDRSLVVYELWNRVDQKVYWFSRGFEYLCDVRKDPLKLKKFFPVPEPLSATLTNDTLIPVPDFMEWQDQAIQLDELTQRIAMLTKACKVAGTYDAANGALKRLLNESTDNQLIPVDAWAAHSDKGGVAGSISFLPLKEIQECISTLQEVRASTKQDLDEITGLSDVIRGTTDSRETLGGLRLKNNNAGTRLTDRQVEVAKFSKEVLSLVAEVMAKHFSDETLIQASGILFEEELQPENVKAQLEALMPKPQQKQPQDMSQQPPGLPGSSMQHGPTPPGLPPPPPNMGAGNNVVPFPGASSAPAATGVIGGGSGLPAGGAPQSIMNNDPMSGMMMPDIDSIVDMIIGKKVQDAIDLLRKDITRGYRIDIETDSTIFGDQMQEKQDAKEFIEALTAFFTSAGAITAQEPETLPLFGRVIQFGVRKFRTGRDIESFIDEFVNKMDKKAKQLRDNPPKSPDQQKAESSIQIEQMKASLQGQNDQRDSERQAANDQREAELQQQDDLRKMMADKQSDERKAQMEQQAQTMEMEKMRMTMELEKQKMMMELEIARQKHSLEMHKMKADLDKQTQEHEMAREQHAMTLHSQRETHKMNMDATKAKTDSAKEIAKHKTAQAKKPQPKGKAA